MICVKTAQISPLFNFWYLEGSYTSYSSKRLYSAKIEGNRAYTGKRKDEKGKKKALAGEQGHRKGKKGLAGMWGKTREPETRKAGNAGEWEESIYHSHN